MKKFLSCLLSASLISMSVTPSLAQLVSPRSLRGAGKAVSTTGTKGISRSLGTGARAGLLSEAALMSRMQLPLSLKYATFLSSANMGSIATQMLSHSNVAQRALLLRTDFPVLALNSQTSPHELFQATQFYRDQLTKSNELLTKLPKNNNAISSEQMTAVAGLSSDVASLGLFGIPSDANLLLNAFENSIGTVAEPIMTAVTARALLRLKAYETLEKMAEESTLQPELWESISTYAKLNKLPVNIPSAQRTTVNIAAWQEPMEQYGLLNTISVNPSAESTHLYMNAGARPQVAQVIAATSKATAGTAEVAQKAVEPVAEVVSPVQTVAKNPVGKATAAQDIHAFRDQGLASEGMEATFPVYWEDKSSGKTLDVSFQFENQAAKEAFYKRVDLAADEYFVFDRGTGGIVIRQELTPEQKANEAKPKERGFFKIFFEGGQKTPLALYKVLFSREMKPAFESAKDLPAVMELLSTYRADLKQILSAELLAKYPALQTYLGAKNTVLDKATIELLETGKVMKISKDIAAELDTILAVHSGTPIKVFKDDIGHWAQNFAGFAEGTFGTMGQANTSALGLLGISKGFLSNLPTAMGQFGPAWAPFIGAWAEKYGTKKLLNAGQLLGAGGHLTAAASLTAGALGALPPLEAFAGMVGGITINGVAGSILKQINPMVAKQRTSDPVSSSATITDLNSWASVGGMYCYLFLPAVGALSWLLTGNMETTLGSLAGMFGVAASIPLTANLLLRKSRIQNVVKNDAQKGVLKTIGNNLKFGFKSPLLRNMFFATAGGHFMGLGFNSGPGHFIKENISNTSLAMAVSFLSIYLTVFAGRKLGAKAMQKGFIGDKALAGLSGLVGVSMGAASLLPGLDFATRCGLFAAAGLGFSNWVNVLQSIELSRPENIGKEAAVSSMYILARTSGMATMLMGAFGDQLGALLGLSPSTAALYALTMPLAAGTASMLINRQYITQDLWPTAKRWGISAKNWIKAKLGMNNSNGAQGAVPTAEATAL